MTGKFRICGAGANNYHCAEHLYTLAKAQFDDPLDVEQWVEAATTWLCLDQPPDADADAAGEIRKLIGYLADVIAERRKGNDAPALPAAAV